MKAKLKPTIDFLDSLYNWAGIDQKLRNQANKFKKELIALSQQSEPKWIPVSERLPDKMTNVNACHIGKNGKQIISELCYVPEFSMQLDDEFDFDGIPDHKEETGHHFWPKGWYSYDHIKDYYWAFDDNITHWQPLPTPPETKGAEK